MQIENRTINVFISYQTDDKITAGKLKKELSIFSIDCFLAHEDLDVSSEWQDEILKEIKKSSLFICLLSEKYLKSSFCMQESGMAVVLNMTIIPLSLDGTVSPGFISKFQSRRIDSLNPSIKDIIPGLLKYNEDDGIRIIIDLLGASGSYRNAESNFEYILPFLDKLTENQALLLIDKVLGNNQIYGAHLCATKHIPQIAKTYSHLLTKTEYHKIKRICAVYGVSI